MNAVSPRDHRRHTAGTTTSPQAGVSLLEVLIALAIVSLISVPMAAWMMLGFRSSDASERRLQDSNSTNLLATWWARDVQSAAAITLGGPDCVGGEGAVGTAGTTGAVVLGAVDATGSGRVVYTVLTEGTPAVTSLFRRTCKVAPAAGDVTDVSRLATDIALPPGVAAWSGLATCAPRAGTSADTCGQAALRFAGRSGEVISVSATKRVGGPWPS